MIAWIGIGANLGDARAATCSMPWSAWDAAAGLRA
jgi:hypothetical protein